MPINSRDAERITEEYNPEFDMRRDGPRVTWAENDLALLVIQLISEVKQLREDLDWLTRKTDTE